MVVCHQRCLTAKPGKRFRLLSLPGLRIGNQRVEEAHAGVNIAQSLLRSLIVVDELAVIFGMELNAQDERLVLTFNALNDLHAVRNRAGYDRQRRCR